jgi:hypothetical protein
MSKKSGAVHSLITLTLAFGAFLMESSHSTIGILPLDSLKNITVVSGIIHS